MTEEQRNKTDSVTLAPRCGGGGRRQSVAPPPPADALCQMSQTPLVYRLLSAAGGGLLHKVVRARARAPAHSTAPHHYTLLYFVTNLPQTVL